MKITEDMSAAQFENVNALRSFPFQDESALVDREGRPFPKDLVVDLHLVVPLADGASLPEVRLTSAHVSPAMVSVCFVSRAGGRTDALSATVSRDAFEPYVPYRLEKLHGSEDVGGIVTFGDFEFPGFPETYFMDAKVHSCCVAAYKPAGLRRFVDPRSGESVSGDAQIGFTGYVSTSLDGKSFSLSLEDGAAEALASECSVASGSEACGATPIASINGVRPDDEGNIVLWFH